MSCYLATDAELKMFLNLYMLNSIYWSFHSVDPQEFSEPSDQGHQVMGIYR